MKKTSSRRTASVGCLAVSTGLVLLSGCFSDSPSGRGGYRASRDVQVPASMVFEDDYEYFPVYEVYYSRNRREYVYRTTGGQWVRSSQPSIVPLNELLDSPSVPVDFHDSPERHHENVARTYPKTWRPSEDTSEKLSQKPGEG